MDDGSPPHGAGDDDLLGNLLSRLDRGPAAELLDGAFEVLSGPLGLRYLHLYVVDFGEQELCPVPLGPTRPGADPLPLGESVGGRCYSHREVEEERDADGSSVWIPLYRRADGIGVLRLGLAEDGLSRVRGIAESLGLVLAAAIAEADRYSDTFQVPRGARNLRLAAALQRDLLPLTTYRDERVEIAGRVEPAYDIAGDAFDYAVNDSLMEFAVFDAMGHGLESTILTTLAIGGYRFSRRRRDRLRDVAVDVDMAVSAYEGEVGFVTGQLFRLELDRGAVTIVNAGHPLPLLVRDGRVEEIPPVRPMLPFGLGSAPETLGKILLEPGDLLVCYTDGMVESRDPSGRQFGSERLIQVTSETVATGEKPEWVARAMLETVKGYVRDDLSDDATLLVVRWSG